MSDTFRCIVAVPSGQHWLAQFGVDLINLFNYFPTARVAGYRSQELRLVNVRSSILSKNRLDAVKAAKQYHATHILFIDTDHTFPKDLVQRLARPGYAVNAVNCVTKQIPACPTARKKSATDPKGEVVYSDVGDDSHEQVWRVGTGVMLIAMSVFDKIGMGVWDMKYLPEVDTYQGEDWSFCEACERAGIKIYVDHGLSREVGHVGNYEFTHDVVGELREAQ